MLTHLTRIGITSQPHPVVPDPLLISSEVSTWLIYETDASSEAARVLVRFECCLWAGLGYPNDEAISGHPLWEHGLRPFETWEVHGSPLLTELRHRNAVAFSHQPSIDWGSDLRHFVFSFKENTCEVLAKDFLAEVIQQSRSDIINQLLNAEKAIG